MKKIFSLIFFLGFLSSLPSFAQKLGIKAGGNYAGVMGKDGNGDKIEGLSFLPGFHGGGFLEVDLGQTVSVQLEACYSQKGYRLKTSDKITAGNNTITTEMDYTNKFGYLDVPAILNIHFGEAGGYIGLGPQVSFLMSRRFDGKIVTTTVNTSTTPPTSSTNEFTDGGSDKDGISKTDFGVTFGLGSKWESGIEYCLRAGLGLGNIVDQSTSSSRDVLHHLVFSASIGYAFNVGGGGGGDRYGHKYGKPKKHR